MSADGVAQASDFLLNCAGGDGLADGPIDGFDEPGVAAEADLLGSGVDAFYEFVGESERDLLHDGMVSDLTSDIRSDIIIGMNIIGIQVSQQEYERFEQIRREMLASNKSLAEAEHWGACSIGIGQQFTTAKISRDEYATQVHAGSVEHPITLVLTKVEKP